MQVHIAGMHIAQTQAREKFVKKTQTQKLSSCCYLASAVKIEFIDLSGKKDILDMDGKLARAIRIFAHFFFFFEKLHVIPTLRFQILDIMHGI